MVKTDLPDWVHRLPGWVRPDEIRWMRKRPWIAGFIEADDYTLDHAVERFERSQRRFKNLRAGRTAELIDTRTLETTTALRTATIPAPGFVRSVRIQSPDARRVRGLAVPYGQPSLPVQVSGIVALEQFDRDSLTPIPPSTPFCIGHDRRQVLGRATPRHTTEGLAIDAVINDHDRPRWIQRWIRGEHASLSIAFAGHPIFDEWSHTTDGLPLRTVRGAQLVEVSVVSSPAYTTARITEVV